MKIGHTVPFHGGNGKLFGDIPIMRLLHKDGLNTDRMVKFVYLVGNYSFAAQNSATIECKIYRVSV